MCYYVVREEQISLAVHLSELGVRPVRISDLAQMSMPVDSNK